MPLGMWLELILAVPYLPWSDDWILQQKYGGILLKSCSCLISLNNSSGMQQRTIYSHFFAGWSTCKS